MDRKIFLALREPRWRDLFPGKDLRVLLVPASMPDLMTAKLLGITNERLERDLCTNAFIGFEGYNDDDGMPVENSLESRLELYSFPAARARINQLLEDENAAPVIGDEVGEEIAVSV